MSKIRKSARGEDCTARIPGVCNFDPETTILAHISGVRYGSGKGKKVSDLISLYACSACHDVIDRRTKTDHDRDFVEKCMLEGHLETLMKLEKKGLV